MADPISQRLMPRERVLWRETPNEGSFSVAWGPALLGAMAGAAMDPNQNALTIFLLVFLLLMTGRSLLDSRSARYTSTAITNERFIVAHHLPGDELDEALQFNSFTLRWIQGIEILPGALRLTLADGRVKVIAPLDDATKIGLAVAEAANLQRPWTPSTRERLAQECVVLAAFAAAALAYTVTFCGLGAEAAEIGKLQALAVKLPPALLASLAGGVLGILAAIAAIKPYLTVTEMRAWMRQSGFFAPRPEPGARTHVFARFCLSFVDLLYDRPTAPASEEPGES